MAIYRGKIKKIDDELLDNRNIIFCIGAIFDPSGDILGSLVQFLKNFFLIDATYNGAWWFMLIYLMLTALSGVLYHICKKWNPLVVTLGAGFFYLVAYMIRFEKLSITCNNAVGIWMIAKVALYGHRE